jgi:hypothetical protein
LRNFLALGTGIAQPSAPAGRQEPPGIAPPANQPPARLVLIELADPTHKVIDTHTSSFEIPQC